MGRQGKLTTFIKPVIGNGVTIFFAGGSGSNEEKSTSEKLTSKKGSDATFQDADFSPDSRRAILPAQFCFNFVAPNRPPSGRQVPIQFWAIFFGVAPAPEGGPVCGAHIAPQGAAAPNSAAAAAWPLSVVMRNWCSGGWRRPRCRRYRCRGLPRPSRLLFRHPGHSAMSSAV